MTESTKILRDGSKALVDRVYPATASSPKGIHTRTLYDLQAGKSYTWHPNDASRPCGASTFSGDWGDFFAMSAKMTSGLDKQGPSAVGTETLNGLAAKVMQIALPGGRGNVKIWLHEKYGFVVKSEMIPAEGAARTMLEVKQFSLDKPPASAFVLPAVCAQAPGS